MSSYENINYALRPAKAVERKMFCEAFRKLHAFRPVSKYRYIGFGSTYFSDFLLFHKALNFGDMLSIEQDADKQERFIENKPYKCIEMQFDHSNSVLPRLEWDKPAIIWLDYDGCLSDKVLSDISTVCTKAVPESMLIISVNANPEKTDKKDVNLNDFRIEKLKKNVGAENMPVTTGLKLGGWGTAEICRKIMLNKIEATLSARNGPRSKRQRIVFQQLFNFHYADGARMLTVGGVLHTKRQSKQFREAKFEELPFYKDSAEAYEIRVPNLTYREIRKLDTLLPTGDQITLPGVDEADIKIYSEIYRYFPTFAEAEF